MLSKLSAAFLCILHYLRTFDVETGKELWKGLLPNSGPAILMIFMKNGKQYVVTAASWRDKISEEKPSDELVAFTLP